MSKYYNHIVFKKLLKKFDMMVKKNSDKKPLYIFIDINCQPKIKIYFILLTEFLPALVENLHIENIVFKAKKESFSLYLVIYIDVLYPKNDLRKFIKLSICGYLGIELELKDIKIYRSKKSLKSCFVLY